VGITATGAVTGGTIVSTGSAIQTGNSWNLTAALGLVTNAWSVNVGMTTNGAAVMSAGGFFTISDARIKTKIEDLTAKKAIDWISRGRPVTYMIHDRPGAGFIAQEELINGRGDAVTVVPDPGPEFAQSDGFASDGFRLTRDYTHDVAYLTAALKWCVQKISALEKSVKPVRKKGKARG